MSSQSPENQSQPVVIGTAGHVDHGKSTLTRALTGIDPDRLAEEKARSMTIDLGFAWFQLPSGRNASIVDVPGHEHFIKNMLAGIGGIDLAMLVIAADEGPMPQTLEHLSILELLGIERSVVALTKSDLAEPEFIDYVVEEIRELLSQTALAGSSVVPVSATSGSGLDLLAQELDRVARQVSRNARRGPVRMPIDRVFTVSGFGTVVTGTVLGGSIAPGDELVIMPRDLPVRVRGVQSHQKRVDVVSAGMRAAINIAGIERGQVRRGDVLAPAKSLTSAHRIDATLTLLATAPAALAQNARVDFFTGAAESAAQLTLLESESLEPGQTQMVQLRLGREMAVAPGDRFIVRQASPSLTIGGGAVLDPAPRRHRRFESAVLQRLAALSLGDPAVLVRAAVGSSIASTEEVIAQVGASIDLAGAREAVERLIDQDELAEIPAAGSQGGSFLIDTEILHGIVAEVSDRLDEYHGRRPLRPGMPQEDMRAMLALQPKPFESLVAYLESREAVVRENAVLRRPEFAVTLDDETSIRTRPFLDALQSHPFNPPSPADYAIEPELLAALEYLGLVVRLSDAMAFDAAAYARLTEKILQHLSDHDTISLAELRDLVGTSRKYAQPVLEDLDRKRFTSRVGDVRRRGPATISPRSH